MIKFLPGGTGEKINGEEVSITATTEEQVVTPTEGKNAITKVTVNPVTADIDADISPENIKKDVDILGVIGTLETGGGIDTTSDNPITSEDVAEGKEGFVNGEKVTGTLPEYVDYNNHSPNILLATENYDEEGNTSYLKFTVDAGTQPFILRSGSLSLEAKAADVAKLIGLSAENIKVGEYILGINGTYTSDGDVNPSEVLYGKTSYANGKKVIGTFRLGEGQEAIGVDQVEKHYTGVAEDVVIEENLYSMSSYYITQANSLIQEDGSYIFITEKNADENFVLCVYDIELNKIQEIDWLDAVGSTGLESGNTRANEFVLSSSKFNNTTYLLMSAGRRNNSGTFSLYKLVDGQFIKVWNDTVNKDTKYEHVFSKKIPNKFYSSQGYVYDVNEDDTVEQVATLGINFRYSMPEYGSVTGRLKFDGDYIYESSYSSGNGGTSTKRITQLSEDGNSYLKMKDISSDLIQLMYPYVLQYGNYVFEIQKLNTDLSLDTTTVIKTATTTTGSSWRHSGLFITPNCIFISESDRSVVKLYIGNIDYETNTYSQITKYNLDVSRFPVSDGSIIAEKINDDTVVVIFKSGRTGGLVRVKINFNVVQNTIYSVEDSNGTLYFPYDNDSTLTDLANVLENSGTVIYKNGIGRGTMKNNGAVELTPTTSDQLIPKGYHDGTGKVLGDANLLPENIVKGITIFGVEGTAEVTPVE